MESITIQATLYFTSIHVESVQRKKIKETRVTGDFERVVDSRPTCGNGHCTVATIITLRIVRDDQWARFREGSHGARRAGTPCYDHSLRCFSAKRSPSSLRNRYYLLSRSLLSSLCNQPRSYLPSSSTSPSLFYASSSKHCEIDTRLRTRGASRTIRFSIEDQTIETYRPLLV